MGCVDSSNDKLTEATDEHSIDEEDSATTPLSDDAAVDDNDDNSYSSQDT